MDRGAWKAAVHGVAQSQTRLSDFTFPFHFHALEKEMATHSSVLAWRIPGTGEPGGPPSMGSHSRTRLQRLSSGRLHLWRLPRFLPHGPLGLLCFWPSLLPHLSCLLQHLSAESLLPSSVVKGSHIDIEPFLIQDNFLILKSISLILSIKSLLLYS